MQMPVCAMQMSEMPVCAMQMSVMPYKCQSCHAIVGKYHTNVMQLTVHVKQNFLKYCLYFYLCLQSIIFELT